MYKTGDTIQLHDENRVPQQYLLHECIGEGHSCFVYKATIASNTSNTGTILLKIPKSENDAYFNTAYQKNIQIQQHLEIEYGSNVLQYLHDNNNLPVIIMTYDGGCTYGDYRRQLNETESIINIISITEQIIKWIKRIHDCGYVHLDLKPDNMLVSHDGLFLKRIIDFDSTQSIADIQNMTIPAESISSSMAYAAPEVKKVLQGYTEYIPEIGIHSDYYSIGKIMQQGILGNDAGDTERINTLKTPNGYLLQDSRILQMINELLDQLLEKDPHKRATNPIDIINQLNEIKQGLSFLFGRFSDWSLRECVLNQLSEMQSTNFGLDYFPYDELIPEVTIQETGKKAKLNLSLLSDDQINILYGESGSGKTVLLKKLTAEISETEDNCYAIWLPLSELFYYNEKTVWELLCKYVFNTTYSISNKEKAEAFLRESRNYRLLFIFDGINELGKNTQGKIIEEISQFGEFPNVISLVSSNTTLEEQTNCTVFEVATLKSTNVKIFMQKELGIDAPDDLIDLLSNPALLMDYIRPYVSEEAYRISKYKSPSEIIASYIQFLQDKFSNSLFKEKNKDHREISEKTFHALQNICWQMIANETLYIRRNDVWAALHREFPYEEAETITYIFNKFQQSVSLLRTSQGGDWFKISHERYRNQLASIFFKANMKCYLAGEIHYTDLLLTKEPIPQNLIQALIELIGENNHYLYHNGEWSGYDDYTHTTIKEYKNQLSDDLMLFDILFHLQQEKKTESPEIGLATYNLFTIWIKATGAHFENSFKEIFEENDIIMLYNINVNPARCTNMENYQIIHDNLGDDAAHLEAQRLKNKLRKLRRRIIIYAIYLLLIIVACIYIYKDYTKDRVVVLTSLDGLSFCQGETINIEQVYFENWKGDRLFRKVTEEDVEMSGFKIDKTYLLGEAHENVRVPNNYGLHIEYDERTGISTISILDIYSENENASLAIGKGLIHKANLGTFRLLSEEATINVNISNLPNTIPGQWKEPIEVEFLSASKIILQDNYKDQIYWVTDNGINPTATVRVDSETQIDNYIKLFVDPLENYNGLAYLQIGKGIVINTDYNNISSPFKSASVIYKKDFSYHLNSVHLDLIPLDQIPIQTGNTIAFKMDAKLINENGQIITQDPNEKRIALNTKVKGFILDGLNADILMKHNDSLSNDLDNTELILENIVINQRYVTITLPPNLLVTSDGLGIKNNSFTFDTEEQRDTNEPTIPYVEKASFKMLEEYDAIWFTFTIMDTKTIPLNENNTSFVLDNLNSIARHEYSYIYSNPNKSGRNPYNPNEDQVYYWYTRNNHNSISVNFILKAKLLNINIEEIEKQPFVISGFTNADGNELAQKDIYVTPEESTNRGPGGFVPQNPVISLDENPLDNVHTGDSIHLKLCLKDNNYDFYDNNYSGENIQRTKIQLNGFTADISWSNQSIDENGTKYIILSLHNIISTSAGKKSIYFPSLLAGARIDGRSQVSAGFKTKEFDIK